MLSLIRHSLFPSFSPSLLPSFPPPLLLYSPRQSPQPRYRCASVCDSAGGHVSTRVRELRKTRYLSSTGCEGRHSSGAQRGEGFPCYCVSGVENVVPSAVLGHVLSSNTGSLGQSYTAEALMHFPSAGPQEPAESPCTTLSTVPSYFHHHVVTVARCTTSFLFCSFIVWLHEGRIWSPPKFKMAEALTVHGVSFFILFFYRAVV